MLADKPLSKGLLKAAAVVVDDVLPENKPAVDAGCIGCDDSGMLLVNEGAPKRSRTAALDDGIDGCAALDENASNGALPKRSVPPGGAADAAAPGLGAAEEVSEKMSPSRSNVVADAGCAVDAPIEPALGLEVAIVAELLAG